MRWLIVLWVGLGLGCGDDGEGGGADSPDTAGASDGGQPDAASAAPDASASVDDRDPVCDDPAWTPGPCVAGEGLNDPDRGNRHIPDEVAIEYADPVPASGNHRGMWARWGEYHFLPPQRWLHNLEHGGAAFLYHPCAEPAMIDALRAVARAQTDPDGAFRWVLTPYPDLPAAVAVVTWTWRYQAECVDADEISAFIERTYRRAPEDVASDGAFASGWIGR